MITPSQRPLPTQQTTNTARIHCLSEIRTRSPRNQGASDPRHSSIRPQGLAVSKSNVHILIHKETVKIANEKYIGFDPEHVLPSAYPVLVGFESRKFSQQEQIRIQVLQEMGPRQ
jgi:hypothetical protein